jgi:cell division protein FtsB
MSTRINPVRRFLTSRLFLLVTLPVVFMVTFGYLRSLFSGYKINQEISALQTEIQSLKKGKLESMRILDYVMSDSFVEAKARTELNMKKPGENVIIVTNSKNDLDSELENDISSTAGQVLSNPVKWWYYFNGKKIEVL